MDALPPLPDSLEQEAQVRHDMHASFPLTEVCCLEMCIVSLGPACIRATFLCIYPQLPTYACIGKCVRVCHPCLQALLASPPPDSCASIRIDLTHLPAYTLDDTDTTEIDDALSVEFLETDLETDKTDSNGLQSSTTSAAAGDTEGVQGPGEPVVGVLGSHVRVWVHVSDPTRWLAPNSALVDAARLRTRTLYFPFGKVRS